MNGFASSAPSICDPLKFSAVIYYNANDATPDGPHVLDDLDPTSAINFSSDGSFTILSDSLTLLGDHQIEIRASLTNHPSVSTTTVTIIPIAFRTCPVTVAPWKLNDLAVQAGETVLQTVVSPQFSYTTDANCGYLWQSYEFSIAGEDGQQIQESGSFVSFDPALMQFTFTNSGEQLSQDMVYTVSLVAKLSDSATQARASFKVT